MKLFRPTFSSVNPFLFFFPESIVLRKKDYTQQVHHLNYIFRSMRLKTKGNCSLKWSFELRFRHPPWTAYIPFQRRQGYIPVTAWEWEYCPVLHIFNSSEKRPFPTWFKIIKGKFQEAFPYILSTQIVFMPKSSLMFGVKYLFFHCECQVMIQSFFAILKWRENVCVCVYNFLATGY